MTDRDERAERIRVLIVEDHAGMAETIQQVLALDSSIDVIGTESTGADGLERATEETPDIVLMDFALPDMTGAAVATALRTVQPTIRVIGMTASDEPGAFSDMVGAGAYAWLQKQDAMRELRDAIHRVYKGEDLMPSGADVKASSESGYRARWFSGPNSTRHMDA